MDSATTVHDTANHAQSRGRDIFSSNGRTVSQSRRFCSILCITLFLVCLCRYWVRFDPSNSVPSAPESYRLAYNLYDSGRFANPFAALDTGPSAHLSPVYPAILFLLMKVFGKGSSGIYAIELAAVVVVCLQVALFPVFSRLLGMGQSNGVVAAFLWILAKPALVYSWEAFYAALLFAVACCYFRRYLETGPGEPSRAVWVLGALMGLLFLTCETVLPVYAVWLAWDAWKRRLLFLEQFLLPLVLLPMVIVAPWTMRNYLVLHHLILMRDNLGLELSASNNQCAQFGLIANERSGCLDKHHPNNTPAIAREVSELGEAKYNELQLQEATHWIAQHPLRFSQLTLMRLIAFWLPTENFNTHYANGRRLERVPIYLLTLLSAYGLLLLYREDIQSWFILFSSLMVFPLIYYIIQYIDRYRYPILWMTFLLGALPITRYGRRVCAMLSDKVTSSETVASAVVTGRKQ